MCKPPGWQSELKANIGIAKQIKPMNVLEREELEKVMG